MAGTWLRGRRGTWRCGGPALDVGAPCRRLLLAYRQLATSRAGACLQEESPKAAWIEEPAGQS